MDRLTLITLFTSTLTAIAVTASVFNILVHENSTNISK